MPCPAHYTESVLYCCKKKKEQKAQRPTMGIREISVSLSLLFFMGLTSAIKQGDFGIFTACITKNATIRLECYYAHCANSPSFKCEFKLRGEHLGEASDKSCKFFEHGHLNTNQTLNCTCTLTRNKRKEEKQIYIKGKQSVKPCTDNTGLLLCQAPALLWPVILLLWKVLVEDS